MKVVKLSEGVRREYEAERFLEEAFVLRVELDRTLDAAFDERARRLVLYMGELQRAQPEGVTDQVRRQGADLLHNALEDLAERCNRLASLVMTARPS